jgi:hypothetical protein
LEFIKTFILINSLQEGRKMKKKIYAFVITCLLIIGVLYASSPTGLAAITIGGGFGYGYGYENVYSGPIVKCEWEQLPEELYDDDAYTDGLQVLPPLNAGAKRPILYYAVVTHERGVANIQRVDADVYHPDGSPEPYGPSTEGGVIRMPYFKYELPLEYYCTGDQAETIVTIAHDRNLITFNEGYDIYEVLNELDKGTAELWVGCAPIDYEQPAGDYKVYVYAADQIDLSEPLMNTWTYVPMCGVEIDFDRIDFGPTNLNVEKMIAGDTIWNNPAGTNQATVRNVGNVWTAITVEFDDMLFGQDYYDNWNVQFDARMGSDNAYYEDDIMPLEKRTLRNALGLSMKDELDFSIKVLKGTGEHNGEMILDCIPIYPFDNLPSPYSVDDIVGIDARGDYTSEPNPCVIESES